MQVTFWGVRGSIATSGAEFGGIGGNTTCLEVQHGSHRLILDSGTGIRSLGQKLLRESQHFQKPISTSLFFTHLHWDHIQGFPFFSPAFLPSTELTLFGPRRGEHGIEAALGLQMQPPHFPVPLKTMPAEKHFFDIGDGDEVEVPGFEVRSRALCHPQGVLGYRIEAGGKAICFATDTEHLEDGSVDEALLDLARDVDLLIYDAQYTPAEYDGARGTGPCRRGWGHSTYVAAVAIAHAAGAKQLGLFHHDPTHDDQVVEAIEREARALFPYSFAAREGAVVRL